MTIVKISELTSSAGVSSTDLFITAVSGAGSYSTRKTTAQQIYDYVKPIGLATAIATVSSDTSLGTSQHVLLVDASSGQVTLTLPSAATTSARQYMIKKKDSSSNNVVVAASGSQTIDGQASVSVNTQYEALTVVSDGSNWFIF